MATFTIQHFSDSHHAINPTNATLHEMRKLSADARIHTGDAVYDVFEDDYRYLAPYDFMFTVGNHDSILRYGAEHYLNGGMDWSQQPTEQQVYSKFIAPTLASNPVTIQPGKTYWYRDYEDANIRLIGFNCCLMNEAYDAECEWFYRLLEECLNTNTKVFVASHMPPYGVYATQCCFTDELCMPSLSASTQGFALQFYSGVQLPYFQLTNFANKGLEVLGLITGHMHGDGLFVGGTYKKFPILMVASVVIDPGWSNLSRSDDANSAACCLFNQYEYDDVQQTLRIYRVGANGRRTGEVCKMAIWDYTVGDFVNFYSRRAE